MVTKILHKSLLRSSILTAASLAFSLEAMAVNVTRDGVSFSLNEEKHEATVTAFILGEVPQKLSKDTIQYEGNVYTVTSIKYEAFYECNDLVEVSFPNVTSIGEGAFYECNDLVEVSFPNVTSIGEGAFENCNNLKKVSFPNATSINRTAFFNCSNLAEVSFPTVTSIGTGAFYGCAELTEVSFPNVTSIGEGAFENCNNLKKVSFPNATSINGTAFFNCSNLAEVSFPNVTSIGEGAFENCNNLKKVSFPNATSINGTAFFNCSNLAEVSFPTVTSIGTGAFYGCAELTEVSFPNVTSIGTDAFYDCKKLVEVSSPNVTSIKSNAFRGCEKLVEVSFPNVTSIGIGAFNYCVELTKVSFPNVTSIGNNVFKNCPIKTITLNQPDLSKTDATVYEKFGTLSDITLYVPAEALSLYKESEAWSELGFKSIEPINGFVADGIVYTRIGKDSVEVAAGNCYEGELELPATVSDESGKQYTVAGIGKHAFNGCEKLTYIEIPNTVTYIGEEAFQETGLTSVSVPASVTKMGRQPFHFCKSLLVAEILGLVDSLNGTFSECEKLRFVTLPGSLKVFGSYAFFNCKSLESITMKQYNTSLIIVKDESSFGTNNDYTMLNGTKLLVPKGTKGNYENSSIGERFDASKIQEYTPTYKAKIYNDGREYGLGKISMDKKYSFNYIAVVEEYIYDPDFDLTQSQNVIWMIGENQYMANTIRLIDSLPIYFPVDFLANEISYTRTPSIYNEKSEGETGWETLYLPFTATTVTANGVSITPFNYGGKEKTAENISAGNDFWAKEPVMDNENTLYFSHISDAKFEAGMPYLISFPGDGFGKYSLKDQEIVFSNANVNVAATDDLTAGVNCGQYTMAGTCEKLSSADAANYYLFDVNSNMFQKNTEEGVVPFRCYVQKMGQSSEGGSSSGSNLKSSRGNVVFVGSYEDYMAQQDDNTTLQANACADQVVIYAQDGNIILVASESGDATISNLNGQVIKSVNYQEGLNNLGEFAQGVYLINGVKVIVK